MNNSLFHKMEMFNGTLIIINNYELVWHDNLPFSTEVDNLTVGLDQINEFLLFDDSTESATGEKDQALENMLQSTEIICDAGIMHASITNDSKLMPKFDFTPSDLAKGKEIEIYQRCMNINASATPIKEKLIIVGMPAHQLEDQLAFCTTFRPLIGGAHRVRKGGKSNQEEMLVVYAQMDMIYKKRMDKMMDMLKKANPKFFTEYSNSRVIGFWKKKKEEPPVPPVV